MAYPYSEIDQRIIRFLATKHPERSGDFFFESVTSELGMTKTDVLVVLRRLAQHGLLEEVASGQMRVLPQLMDEVQKLDHPPLKDYWKEIVAWFRSKPWSVPLVAIGVLIPILIQWYHLIRQLCQWVYELLIYIQEM